MTSAWIAQTRWWVLAVAGLVLGALPAQAQRVSLTDLQNQIAASVTCPAALPGQPRFVDKGDGTVCDSATGLMWEKKLACADSTNPRCVGNLYGWSSISPFAEPNGTLYSDFLNRLNDLKTPNDGTATPCFATHCDWRIPTIGELRSILIADFPGCTLLPCIDPTLGPTQIGAYWSSSTDTSFVFAAWSISFDIGLVFLGHKNPLNNILYARAVRGGR